VRKLRYSVPHSFRDAKLKNLSPELLAQIKLSVLLGYGFAFSLLAIGGLAPLIAFIIGWQARRRIKQSHDKLVGAKLAWWCIIVGGLGMVIWPLVFLATTLRLFK
jgi:hypothetical protein